MNAQGVEMQCPHWLLRAGLHDSSKLGFDSHSYLGSNADDDLLLTELLCGARKLGTQKGPTTNRNEGDGTQMMNSV